MNERKHNCADERWHEPANLETGHEGAGQQQDDCVDHQKKQPQRQDSQWKRQQLQQKPERRIKESDDQRCHQRRSQSDQFKTGHNTGDQQKGQRAKQPH